MKAAVLHSPGDAPAYVEHPDPEPAVGHTLVAVTATTVRPGPGAGSGWDPKAGTSPGLWRTAARTTSPQSVAGSTYTALRSTVR